jgi:hypothetical protein
MAPSARIGLFRAFLGRIIIPLAKRAFVRCPARLRCVCATAMIAEADACRFNSIQ